MPMVGKGIVIPEKSNIFHGEAMANINKDQLVLCSSYGDYEGPLTVVPNMSPLIDNITTISEIAFSAKNNYMVMTLNASPFVAAYKLDNGVFSVQNVVSAPTAPCQTVSMHPNNMDMIVRISGEPYISALRTMDDGNTFMATTLVDPEDNTIVRMCLDPTGQNLLISRTAAPWLEVYKFNGTKYVYHSKIIDIPSGRVVYMKFDVSGTYLACVGATNIMRPLLTIYKRCGQTFKKLLAVIKLPIVFGRAIAWDPNGKYLAAGIGPSPYLFMYERNGDTFTEITSNIDINVPQAVTGLSWDPSGTFLAVSHNAMPGVTVYKRTGNTFNKVTTFPNVLTADGSANCITFSKTGEYLCVGHSQGLTVFRAPVKNVVMPYTIEADKLMSWSLLNKLGYAKNTGAVGDNINVSIVDELNKPVF